MMPHSFAPFVARLRAAILLLSALALAAPRLDAQDIVILRNDNEFEGRIIEDRDDILVMLVDEPAGRVALKYENLVEVNGIPAGRILGLRSELQDFLDRIQRRRALTPVGPILKQFLEPKRASGAYAAGFATWFPQESMKGEQRVLERFSLVPSFVSIWESRRDTAGDPQPALYNPVSRTLYVSVARSGRPEKEDRTDRSVTRPAYSSPLEKLLLYHELQHLLQHQNFDQDSGSDQVPSGDTKLALTCLREGDADLATLDYLAEETGVDPGRLTDVVSCLQLVPHATRERLASLPPFLADVIAAPHEFGLRFARQVRQAGGWGLMAKVHKDPPVSTEQVMHPEKYLVKRESPVRFGQINLAAAIKIPAMELWSDTWGELRTYLLLRRFVKDDATALAAAAGWQGDRLTAIQRTDTGQTILAWMTTWDSENDAMEFFRAIQGMFEARFTESAGLSLRKLTESTPTLYLGEVTNEDGVLQQRVLVEVNGKDAVVVESPHVASADALRQALHDSGRIESDLPVRVQVPAADVLPIRLDETARVFWQGAGLSLSKAGLVVEGALAGAAEGKAAFAIQEGWAARPDGAIALPLGASMAVIAAETFELPFEATSTLIGLWSEGRGWPAASPRAARRVLRRFPAWTQTAGSIQAYVTAEVATDAELAAVARIYRVYLVKGTSGLLLEIKIPEESFEKGSLEVERVLSSLQYRG